MCCAQGLGGEPISSEAEGRQRPHMPTVVWEMEPTFCVPEDRPHAMCACVTTQVKTLSPNP